MSVSQGGQAAGLAGSSETSRSAAGPGWGCARQGVAQPVGRRGAALVTRLRGGSRRALALVWGLVGLCGTAHGASAAAPAWPLEERIHAAASDLHAQIGPAGQMTYRRFMEPGLAVPAQRYNLLRHAGSLLALADYHVEFPPTGAQRASVDQAFHFLRQCCLRPSQDGVQDLALWSEPGVVRGRRSYAVAKLGGAGLTLAALATWRRVHPDAVRLDELQALGRFVLSMQNSDGLFRSLHAPDEGQHDPTWASLYYPGEAALGLVLLYEQDGNLRWLQAAMDALLALARTREGRATPPPDHWALLATAQLHRLRPAALTAAVPPGFSWLPAAGLPSASSLLTDHALRVASGMLAEQQGPSSLPCARGGFTPDGRTTPTATRLEGLLALLTFLPDAGDQRARVRTAVDAGMRFLLAAQHEAPSVRGAFSRSSPVCSPTDSRAGEIRIDYVQHALAAMQAYRAGWRTAAVP
jgi:hypothetical protein